MAIPSAADVRKASLREARALAHPLRLRILRLCNGQDLTNKDLADQLSEDPGTTLHHVRILVDTGFLAATEVRNGARGALERPYRATGKSWDLDVSTPAIRDKVGTAAIEALRQELADPTQRISYYTRLGVVLTDDLRIELAGRLDALVNQFEARQGNAGERTGIFILVHHTSKEQDSHG